MELLLTNVNQVPSLCDFSRCLFNCLNVLNSLNSVYMSTASHQCEYEHEASVQFSVCHKQLLTVRTVIWSSVAVYTFMSLQVA